MTFTTAFEKTLSNNSDTWGGATLVQLIPSNQLSGAASKLRLTLQGSTLAPTEVLSAHIGHRGTGDSWDFAGTPVAITVGGNNSFELAQSGSAVTDEIIFAYNGTSDLLVAFTFTTNTAKDDIRTLFSSNGTQYFYKYGTSSGESATVNKSGYSSSNPNALAIISKIEVEQTAPPPPPPEPIDWKIKHFTVTRPCEIVSSMPVVFYGGSVPMPWTRIAHLPVDVQAGDILHIDTVFQCTSDLSYWVEITGCVVLDSDSSGTAGMALIPHFYDLETPTGAKLLTPVNGENMGPRSMEHHHILRMSTNYEVPAGFSGTKYIAILAYAGGDSFTSSGHAILIDGSSAQITCIRHRPVYEAV